ncbi:InlB B-repeat-containing protein, partial [Paenibacillus koleovorans]|uniref:InlB B-repeat-containing protein n=1 Tax=Paenibacillus koleovorans TaxID=121608 RepID=UPI00158094AD
MTKLFKGKRFVTKSGITILFMSLLLLLMGTQAFALKERAPIAALPNVSYAAIVNSDWMQIKLYETPYNNANVTNTQYYTITSSNDAAFSGGVKPTLVNYRYFPEQAPYYPTLTGNAGRIVDSYDIFLKLPSGKTFQEGKTYTVTINTAVVTAGPFTFAFDLAKPNLVIHSNQVGYLTNGSKVAYLSLWTGQGTVNFSGSNTFQIINESSGNSVYTGNIALSLANDRWSKSDIYSFDFTSFQTPGNYHIYIPNVGRSYSFKISSNLYKDEIGYTVIRGMTMQRDGNHGLDNPNVTHWTRPPAHLDDAIDEALYAANGGNASAARVDLTGGHMDAGDRGKYPYNSAWTGAVMLSAATYFPNQILALGESLDLPESGNGKPDFLDELVYELDWLYKAVMNTSRDGTLANFLRPSNGGYEQGKPPEGATGRIFFNKTQGPNKAETLFAAGTLAMAYNTPIMQQYYPTKVQQYLTAALKAYNGFKAHKDDPDYLHESTTYDTFKVGTPNTWSDEMLFAASSLLTATGNVNEFMPWINSELPLNMNDYNSTKQWSWVTDSPWVNTFVSMYNNPYLSSTLRQWAYNGLVRYAEDEMNHQTPFGAAAQDEGFPNAIGWRFSSATMFPVVIGYGLTGDARYLERIQKTWNYELGSNAVSRSFITGLGDPQREPRSMVNEIGQYQYVQYANGNGGWPELAPGLPNADLQSSAYPYWYNDAHNTVAKTKMYPDYSNYAVMYRYTDAWNTSNEYVIVTLAKNASSMLPLIPISTTNYNLTVQATNGTVTPSGGTYSSGTVVTLTATPNAGYTFTGWSGDLSGSANPATITMNGNKTVTANFSPATMYTLSTSATNGSITLSPSGGTYASGTVVTVTATPNSGYTFTGWGGNLSGTTNPTTITMNGNKSVTASFTAAPPTSYQSVDITTTNAGSTSESGGVITVQGSGAQVWSNSDGFRYVYNNSLTGDATIVAKVNSFTATNNGAMAGVMIRQGT